MEKKLFSILVDRIRLPHFLQFFFMCKDITLILDFFSII